MQVVNRMVEINTVFLKTWREKYSWPLCEGRRASEERIFHLEELVKNNVLCQGSKSIKKVVLEIVMWKTSKRFRTVETFQSNTDEETERVIKKVLELLHEKPNNVVEPIKKLTTLDGVKIAVASAILRFLDPFDHKYGIIDKNIAAYLNCEGITKFLLRSEDNYVMYTQSNIREYQKFHDWLHEKAREISRITYIDIYGAPKNFTPVDIEMALFAFTIQAKKKCF